MKPFFITRRTALTALSGARLLAQQPPPTRLTPADAAARVKPGGRPTICMYSGNLSKIPYAQLPDIVNQLGYEGIDLTVMQGGHVDPSRYMVQLDRALQVFWDAGLAVPMVTTSFTSPSDTYAYVILYVCGMQGIRLCRLGIWPGPPVPDATGQNSAARAAMMRNALTQFAVTGRQCKITPLLANHAGSYPGRSIPEADAMIGGVPPDAFGYCFDPAQAVMEAKSPDAWAPALAAALPRLKAVAISDVALKDGVSQLCPMGTGVIDWKKLFSQLHAAGFNGPLSIRMEYETRNDISAMKQDLAFVRSQLDEAWKA